MVRLSLFLSLGLALVGCPPAAPYGFDAPPAEAAPASLEPAFWSGHLTGDLLPYWMMRYEREVAPPTADPLTPWPGPSNSGL